MSYVPYVVQARRGDFGGFALLAGFLLAVACATPPPEAPAGRPGPTAEPSTLDAGATYAATQPCEVTTPPRDAGARANPRADGGVNGSLPAAAIQRTVREGFGVFRLCYERGLARNSRLAGQVNTKFVIETDGSVRDSHLACTSLPDDIAVACVVEGFRRLHFPSPDGGVVTVGFPIIFNP